MKIEIITSKPTELRFFPAKTGYVKKTCERLIRYLEKIAKQYQSVLRSLTAVLFTGSLFLGGSYLFFVQLAEYGW